MELTELDTDVSEANPDAFNAADDDDVTINLQHYQLDEERDLQFGTSLDTGTYVPTEYVVAYDYEGPVQMESKYSAAMQAMEDLDAEQQQAVQEHEPESVDEFVEALNMEADVEIPDRVSGAEVYHSNEDGEIGLTFISREETSLDEIIAEFTEEDN